MDVFPTTKTEALAAIQHPGKWDPFESLMQQGRVQAFISYMDLSTQRIFHHLVEDWTANKLYVDNFRRSVKESKQVGFFEPDRVSFGKVCKKLKANPTSEKKTSNQRMNFKLDNVLLVKQYFSFGFWTVAASEGHVFQTTDAPMLVYQFDEGTLKCKPRPSTVRRSFVEQDQCHYKRFVLRPDSVYVVPPGVSYLVLTVQKTLFSVDVMAWEDVRELQDFRNHKTYNLAVYNLPPPTPAREFQEGPKMVRPKDRLEKKQKLQQPEIVLDPTDTIIFYDNEPMMDWEEIMHKEVPSEDLKKFLEEFDAGMTPTVMPSSSLPPPPDNYFGESEGLSVPPSLPAPPDNGVVTMESELPVPEDLPLDYSMNGTVGPRKTHVFRSIYPLDLRVNI